MIATALAVFMLADTVDIAALTVQAADLRNAETAVAAISANDAAAYGIATFSDTTENPVQVKKSDGTVDNYATIYAFREETGYWTGCEITLTGDATLGGLCFLIEEPLHWI